MAILKDLFAASIEPKSNEEYAEWLLAESGIALLERVVADEEFVLYAGLNWMFMHAITVPAELVDPPDMEDLLTWNFGVCSGAGVAVTFSDPPRVELSTSMSHTGSSTLDRGTQLIFHRVFEGRLGEQGYTEILQTLTQALGLHFMPERNGILAAKSEWRHRRRNAVVPTAPRRHTVGGSRDDHTRGDRSLDGAHEVINCSYV